MQVYPEPPGSSAVTFTSPTASYAVGKPEAVSFTSQPPQPPPPPSYAASVYQPSASAYGFNPNFASTPAQYGAPAGYSVAPTGYGYPVGPAAPQTQLQNSQNVQVNVVSATTSPPVIVAQPVPFVMTPPSYLGWSIFNFLCCFWPLGLAAVIYSMKVFSARSREQANSYSLTARNLNIAATTIAPILAIVIVGAALGASSVTGSAASRYLHGDTYYSNAYYYSYGYYYYYSYLMYYTYYQSYSAVIYSGSYSYTATRYKSVTATKYATDYNYLYAQGVYYYYYYG